MSSLFLFSAIDLTGANLLMESIISEMKKVLEIQKQLHIQEGPPSLQLRKDRLDRCIAMIKKYQNNKLTNKFKARNYVAKIIDILNKAEKKGLSRKYILYKLWH